MYISEGRNQEVIAALQVTHRLSSFILTGIGQMFDELLHVAMLYDAMPCWIGGWLHSILSKHSMLVDVAHQVIFVLDHSQHKAVSAHTPSA